MRYTKEQLDILEHDPSQHACILAGPGTGKSSTIISYISKIREREPNKTVKLLTFTRAANSELLDKVLEAGHEKAISSTIHSFAISLLLNNPGTSALPEPLRIADDWEWKELIRKDIARRLDTTATIVDMLKNEMSAYWESLSPEENDNVPSELRARFTGMWDEHRRIYGYALLAELPYRLKIALEGNPDLDLGSLELIAVDEYQDLNACDLQCIRLLSDRKITVIAIGDDDQSIYQFRKAHPAGIRNFSTEYQSHSYPLTINHRCGRKILEWANYVIQGDTSRTFKPSLKAGDDNSDGMVGYLVFNREDQEAEGVIRLVRWLTEKEKIPLEEILVLFRTKNIRKLIKGMFKTHNISYADPEEALDLLHHENTREILCILRLLTNKNDSLAWWTLLCLTKGIGPDTVREIYELAHTTNFSFGETIIREARNEFKNISSSNSKLSARVKGILEVLEKVEVPDNARWGSWVMDQIRDSKLPNFPDGMESLLNRVDDFKEDTEQIKLDRYVNQIEPTVKDIMNSKIVGRIRVMTMNRSKGLTVRATIIAGAEDGIIPHPKGYHQEERRLLYVGMTRARDYLYITRCRRRTGYTARSGRQNVGGIRSSCPFLDGGPISQSDGEVLLAQLGF